MPFYINRDWATQSDPHDPSDGRSRTGDKPANGGVSLASSVSTNALLAWQRQEILRLHKENQHLRAEKDRLFGLIEQEKRDRDNGLRARDVSRLSDAQETEPRERSAGEYPKQAQSPAGDNPMPYEDRRLRGA